MKKSLRDAVVDKAVLIAAALFTAALGFASFALADKYHIRREWVFAFWLSVSFVAVIGKSLRRRFRQPMFIVFFAGWLCAHALIMLVAMSVLTLPFWIPVIFVELGVGYALAFRLFGLPSREEIEQAGIKPEEVHFRS